MSTLGNNPGNARFNKIKIPKPAIETPTIAERCFNLAPPTNSMIKQTINNIAAVEKSAGKIRAQIIPMGHKIGVRPNLKSLMTSFL